MNLEDAASKLADQLATNLDFRIGSFTVGHDAKDTIYIYEHYKAYAEYKLWENFEGFKVVRKYIGRIKMISPV